MGLVGGFGIYLKTLFGLNGNKLLIVKLALTFSEINTNCLTGQLKSKSEPL